MTYKRKYVPHGYMTTRQVRENLGMRQYDLLYRWREAGLINGQPGKVGRKHCILYPSDEMPRIRRVHQLYVAGRKPAEILRTLIDEGFAPAATREPFDIEYLKKEDLRRDFHDMPFPEFAKKYGLNG